MAKKNVKKLSLKRLDEDLDALEDVVMDIVDSEERTAEEIATLRDEIRYLWAAITLEFVVMIGVLALAILLG